MGRVGAFLIHLGISSAIFGVLAYLIIFIWYPSCFFETDGGWQGIRLIVFVDIVLGPLLTLVIFNRNKPRSELRRDLAMIAIFQSICLCAGVFVVYSERPIALVYIDGQFYSMSKDDYAAHGVDWRAVEDFPGPYPKKVVVNLPEDLAAQGKIRSEAIQMNRPLRAHLNRYKPFSFEHIDVASEATDPRVLSESAPATIGRWLEKNGGTIDDYLFFPFAARYSYTFLAVSRQTNEIVGQIPIDRFQTNWSPATTSQFRGG